MKTLLLTGASGFLGWNICHFPQKDWKIIGTYHTHPVSYPNITTVKLDITDHDAARLFFKNNKIDAVLHTAALSQPNACAKNPELSLAINVKATVHLAQLCKNNTIPFLFTSSSQVFDGDNAPYSESDTPTPIHIYAQHKLLAEHEIQASYPEAIVVRMPLMYGATSPNSNNFLKDWLSKMKKGELLRVFTDEYRVPASGQSASEALFLLLKKEVNGIFHLAGKDRLSRADFADAMQRVFNIKDANILPCLQSDVKMTAKRPKDLTLNCDRLVQLGFEAKGVEEELLKLKGYF
jgi:dTDP-4-dehydrorhamnose reductase